MDWFVLLTPILLLILLPSVVVFGCSLEKEGSGVYGQRQMILTYTVPKLAPTSINQLKVTYTLGSPQSGKIDTVVKSVEVVKESDTAIAYDNGLFLEAWKVSCICKVEFVGWSVSVNPVEASCDPTTDQPFNFYLSHWPTKDPQTYDDVGFYLTCG